FDSSVLSFFLHHPHSRLYSLPLHDALPILTLLFRGASICLVDFCVDACVLTISSTNVLITLIYACEADLINSNCALLGSNFILTVITCVMFFTSSFDFLHTVLLFR